MYHLAEVRWQQGHRDNAVQLLKNSLEIMESQVAPAWVLAVSAVLWHVAVLTSMWDAAVRS